MGTRFALTQESSASQEFKELCINLKEGDTVLSLKKLSPTRMIKNEFYNAVQSAEDRGASVEEMRELLGRGRSKKGIFEGDLVEGELEIGQVSSLIDNLPTAADVINHIVAEYNIKVEDIITGDFKL
jgi:enoyl-[acyl-carrier protein] reductase II